MPRGAALPPSIWSVRSRAPAAGSATGALSQGCGIVPPCRALVQLKRHVTRLRGCAECPDMIGPVVTGNPVLSPVMLIGQAPGIPRGSRRQAVRVDRRQDDVRSGSRSSASTRKTFRERVYMAAVCRCFPGKAEAGGDRVPSPDEVERCSRHLAGRGPHPAATARDPGRQARDRAAVPGGRASSSTSSARKQRADARRPSSST